MNLFLLQNFYGMPRICGMLEETGKIANDRNMAELTQMMLLLWYPL